MSLYDAHDARLILSVTVPAPRRTADRLLIDRFPGFRLFLRFADFPTRSTFPLRRWRSSGLLPLSFRLQWRGPRWLHTSFPHLPTTARTFSEDEFSVKACGSGKAISIERCR